MVGVVWGKTEVEDEVLLDLAHAFSPRVELCSTREVVLDLEGLARMFGESRSMGDELQRAAAARGVTVRVAIAESCTVARLLVRASGQSGGVTVVASGGGEAALAPLPIELLAEVETGGIQKKGGNGQIDLLVACRRWGLRTLGELTALPPDGVAARLGQDGVRWQRLARGEDVQPLRPWVPDERFEEALDLEWPLEGLEQLAFVLGRVIEPLSRRLARRGRGAAVLHVRLHLVTRVVHERSLQLPAPIHDARTLRTLALLDLESHPPSAAIDRVVVTVDPTPARVLQFSLLTRAQPTSETVSTLLARLYALMGEDRCGSPVPEDSWRPSAFAMTRFAPADAVAQVEVRNATSEGPAVALRRYRFPVPARVRIDKGRPIRVTTDRRGLHGGRVETCAGPWRASGEWWDPTPSGASGRAALPTSWDRDEWDVALDDGATYRVFRDRATSAWFVEGVVD
jgi:protein ImuB